MADRTSARIFGSIFTYLARTPDDPAARAFAVAMWDLKEEAGCDFSDYQMYADDELIALGLARRVPSEFYPGEMQIEYGPADV